MDAAEDGRRLYIDGRFLLQDVTGVQRVAIELVAALDELLVEGELPGWEVVVLAPRQGRLVTRPDYRRVELRRVGRLPSHAWEQLELPGLVGAAPLLCLGNLAPLALLAHPRSRVFTMVHDLSYAWFPEAYSRRFRWLYSLVVPLVLSRSRAVFTVSESERAAILGRYDARIDDRRLVAVQNGGGEGASGARPDIDARALDPGSTRVPTRSRREQRCLYVGSLTRRKNAPGLARAAVDLVRRTDLDVVFVGATGTSFEEAGMALPADAEDRIHFLGQVNDPARIEEEYRRAAVFVFPSFYEASPLPPVEAMRFGCPVVAADIPSLRERCGSAVAYCDPTDIGSIVTRVEEVVTDDDLWASLQAAGLERAAGFSWRAQARAVVARIEEDTSAQDA